MAKTIDLGNNESRTTGLVPQANGTFLALTGVQSKTFKTRAGAEKWLAARGYKPSGERLVKEGT
jgi:hypothetical protein